MNNVSQLSNWLGLSVDCCSFLVDCFHSDTVTPCSGLSCQLPSARTSFSRAVLDCSSGWPVKADGWVSGGSLFQLLLPCRASLASCWGPLHNRMISVLRSSLKVQCCLRIWDAVAHRASPKDGAKWSWVKGLKVFICVMVFVSCCVTQAGRKHPIQLKTTFNFGTSCLPASFVRQVA